MPTRHLASVRFSLPGGEHGRVYLLRDSLPTLTQAFEEAVAQEFVEDDDRERLQLIRSALSAASINFEVYPGESSPDEQYAYVAATRASEHPLFACVLATTAVVRELLDEATYVAETSTFQVVGDLMTSAAMTAGLENWISRVYPDVDLPAVRVNRWPQLEVVRQLDAHLGLFGGWSRQPMVGAPEELSQEALLQ